MIYIRVSLCVWLRAAAVLPSPVVAPASQQNKRMSINVGVVDTRNQLVGQFNETQVEREGWRRSNYRYRAFDEKQDATGNAQRGACGKSAGKGAGQGEVEAWRLA